jgi:hypothetical protein
VEHVAISPLARSKGILISEGWNYEKTESYNSFVHRRFDFGGFGDAICFKSDSPSCLAINATTNSNLSGHLAKYKGNKKLQDWLKAGHRFEIWCWAVMGKQGKRKTWTLKRVPVTEEMVK